MKVMLTFPVASKDILATRGLILQLQVELKLRILHWVMFGMCSLIQMLVAMD